MTFINKYNFIILLALLLYLKAGTLSFPDPKGDIVKNEDNMIIRLIGSDKSSIKTAEAVFTVDQTPENCFNVIKNIEKYPDFMPNIEKTKLVSTSENGKIYDFVFGIAFMDIEYTLLIEDSIINDEYLMNWSFIKGEIKDSSGSWHIKIDPENSNSSVIYYRTFLDPGSFLPDWIVSKLTARSIPDMVEAIREQTKK